ncbi:hypothetical protein C8R43DRAFT_958923 [Mycena crocata]|nr:hypothetical protein C8R43DRAFT_958923 [Mycena crocata]
MPVHNLFMEAQHIVDSLTNAELAAVEWSTHQLEAIRQILCTAGFTFSTTRTQKLCLFELVQAHKLGQNGHNLKEAGNLTTRVEELTTSPVRLPKVAKNWN